MKNGVARATLSVDAIQTMLNAGVARAKALNVKVHICIMDAAANVAGFISFDGAPLIAATTAKRKAMTAVHTGMTTEAWKNYVNSIPASELKIGFQFSSKMSPPLARRISMNRPDMPSSLPAKAVP